MRNFDAAIIGAGPGGYVAAIRCSQLGLKTALVERAQLGGTCLNTGCIPAKALIKNAEIIHEIKHAGKRGLKIAPPEIDLPGTVKMKNRIVAQLTGGVRMLLKANGVDLIKGEAEVLAERVMSVAGEEISFDNLIIATGSSNYIPPLPGLPGVNQDGILTSTEILELEQLPDQLAIIGGGVIGCEFATVFSNFGSKVTIIEMLPNIIAMMDQDVSSALKGSFKAEGVKVLTGCQVTGITKENGKYSIKINGTTTDGTVAADKILVSAGRRPNLSGLEKLNLELEHSYIRVNSTMQTNIKGVYAVGDVTGKVQLAHVASAQGIVAAENIAGQPAAMSYEAVPNCIYTLPEIGSVGWTEEQAKEMYGEVIIGKFPMAACGKAVAMGAATGFTKIVAKKDDGRLLGCHIIGPNATEIIGQAAAVMQKRGTVKDIAGTIHAHPTISETIMEAVKAALGQPIHIIDRKNKY